uniref:Macro domain-containing protein n=2 Tax=Haplochromis burtoni TaxID=8153 RepID=A0A3Q2VHP1_HAPBU
MEKSLPTIKELPLVEKLFKLVEEEFNREMFANYPDVKVIRGSATITLEGPDTDVQSGAAKLDELIKNIKEKRVKFPTALLTFIKTSGAISKYQARFQQSLRNPVFFEVGSDLVLSSLSSDALNEAEAAVMRELKVEIIELQGAAAVPPDLDRVREILMKAKKEANISELRVDASFMPGATGTAMTKVRLVGYSEDVNKLNEVLRDFQINKVTTEEEVKLPHPELVDCFDKVLVLISMKETMVTLKASHVPHPCVLVKGPRSLVQKVRTDLATSLAQLSTDTVVLNELAVQWYFQGDGRQNTKLVERSCQVLIREKQHLQTPTSDLADITITLKGRVKLQVVFGDITNETTDAVVNTTDFRDFQTDGVCKDILRKAGPQVENALKNGKVNSEEILETPPGMFPCKAILHVCGKKDTAVIEQLLRRIIQLCESSGYKSLAVPAICAGSGGLDPDSVAHAILQGVKTAASSHPLQRLTNIRLVLNKLTVFLAFKKKAM